MKKNLIALAITTGILSLTMPSGLWAEDQKPATSDSGDGGACNGPCGGCNGGGKKHHDKGADTGNKPTPAPSPAQ